MPRFYHHRTACVSETRIIFHPEKLPAETLIQRCITRRTFSFLFIDSRRCQFYGITQSIVLLLLLLLSVFLPLLLPNNTSGNSRKNARPPLEWLGFGGHFPDRDRSFDQSVNSWRTAGDHHFALVNYNTRSLSIQVITMYRFLTDDEQKHRRHVK